jgi:hypothetical protein
MNGIDITFDFRMDAGGKDPDSRSPTLKKYQQLLWSKALPNGKVFALDIKGHYLHHKSDLGEFCLSSDFVIPLFSRYTSMQSIIAQIPKSEIDDFFHIGYTIGGEMIWPANRIDNKMTINGARGFNRKISDRFDLTLECVRRFYRSEISPLFDDLARYKSFFDLFNDFKGYVDFFLLQDLVADDYSSVYFFLPFDGFKSSARPSDIESYQSYREKTVEFIHNRNKRISLWDNARRQ